MVRLAKTEISLILLPPRSRFSRLVRLDKKEISIADVNTGRRKLGAIIGDRVATGINVSINLGSMIGNNTQIGPGALAHGVIAPNSRIF